MEEKGSETAPEAPIGKEIIPPTPRKKKRRIPIKNAGDIVFPDLPPPPIRSKQLSVKQIMAKMKEIRLSVRRRVRQSSTWESLPGPLLTGAWSIWQH